MSSGSTSKKPDVDEIVADNWENHLGDTPLEVFQPVYIDSNGEAKPVPTEPIKRPAPRKKPVQWRPEVKAMHDQAEQEYKSAKQGQPLWLWAVVTIAALALLIVAEILSDIYIIF